MMPKSNSQTAVVNLTAAFAHYNVHHPHSAVGYHSPWECIRRRLLQICLDIWGQIHRLSSTTIRSDGGSLLQADADGAVR